MIVPTSLNRIFGYKEPALDELQRHVLHEISLTTAPTMVLHAKDLYDVVPRKKSGSWHFDFGVKEQLVSYLAGAIRAAVDVSALLRVDTPVDVRYTNFQHRIPEQFADKLDNNDDAEIIRSAAAPIPAVTPVKLEAGTSSSAQLPLAGSRHPLLRPLQLHLQLRLQQRR